jgi:phosphoglucomutase
MWEDLSDEVLANLRPTIKNLKSNTWRYQYKNKIKDNFGAFFSKSSKPAASPAKEDLKIKLWPELEKSNQAAALATAALQPVEKSMEPDQGSHSFLKKFKAAARAIKIQNKVVKTMDATLKELGAQSVADLKDMFRDDPTINRSSGEPNNKIELPPVDETPQQRLARLDTTGTNSATLSRSALRALKKEEAALKRHPSTGATGDTQSHKLDQVGEHIDGLTDDLFDCDPTI